MDEPHNHLEPLEADDHLHDDHEPLEADDHLHDHEPEADDEVAIEAMLGEPPVQEEAQAPDDDDPESDEDFDFEEVDDYFTILKYLSKEWLKLERNHQVSKVASEAMWDLAKTWFHKLFMTKNAQGVTRKTPSFIHLRRLLYRDYVPPVHMEIGYLEKETGDVTVMEDTPITPKNRFPPHRYQKLWDIAHVKVTSNQSTLFFCVLKVSLASGTKKKK